MTAILILDDDTRVREALKQLFAEEGFYVDTSQTYDEAEEYLTQQDYRVVVCDWDLGMYGAGKPGDELRRLAEEARYKTSSFQVICFSGLDRDVPDNVVQFRKDEVLRLVDYVRNIGSAQ